MSQSYWEYSVKEFLLKEKEEYFNRLREKISITENTSQDIISKLKEMRNIK